jgi:hypothetical protein
MLSAENMYAPWMDMVMMNAITRVKINKREIRIPFNALG